MDQPWTPRPKPELAERLERRVEFDDYATTRDFLERLNGLCEEQQRFPDISFGRTYVNLTVRAEAEEATIGELEWAFSAAIDGLIA
ncbi:MAG: 4a-hydroxytetrahydrobiopterin dehydratase [Cyanobium sp.]